MTAYSAVADPVASDVTADSADTGNGAPTTFSDRFATVFSRVLRDRPEIGDALRAAVPVQVREARYAAWATAGFAFCHFLLALPDGLNSAVGSGAHFFAAWLTGAMAVLFGIRSRWVWIGSLAVASLQTFLGVFTLFSTEMPTGVGPFIVLAGIMAAGIVLALLLRRDCYAWFARP
ncbi:hypothetical protein HLB23_35560 [Nocardia uniformis]|uniref:Uncharacterized protein n=1 Tax=Nocardia uniformis TaxID=53432 RepID=A0A849CEK8_9NOCA|nr:hypothetical protein [Nocardia uniformis]NNH75110.1 hypothetical protein [Nocardia uniformis]